MKPLGEIVEGFRDIEAETAKKQRKVQAELEEGRREIAQGEDSTGNPLHDGLIVLYGKDLLRSDSTAAANYEKVAAELRGKRGQPVVMIHRWVKHEGCSGFGGKTTPVVKRAISVGIIAEEQLVFDYEKGTCVLPTSSLVSNGDRGLHVPDSAEDGLVVAGRSSGFRTLDLGTDLGRKLGHDLEFWETGHLPANNTEVEAMTLAIGHDGIQEWLTTHDDWETLNNLSHIRKLCEELKIEPIEPAAEWQKRTA